MLVYNAVIEALSAASSDERTCSIEVTVNWLRSISSMCGFEAKRTTRGGPV